MSAALVLGDGRSGHGKGAGPGSLQDFPPRMIPHPEDLLRVRNVGPRPCGFHYRTSRNQAQLRDRAVLASGARSWVTMELLFAAIGGLVGGMIGAIIGVALSARMRARDLVASRSDGVGSRSAFALTRGRRAQSRRAAAYQDAATFSYWAAEYVDRTKPFVEPAPSSPEPLPAEQIRSLEATVALHGSPEVGQLTLAMNGRLRAFYEHADALDKAQVTEQDPLEAWRAVTASRDAFHEAANALRARMAEELRQD